MAATVAAILGDNGGYWIGRTGGLALARRHGRLLRLDEATLERVHAFFARHGAKTVFIGRFVALLRTWAAFFAGTGCMPYGEFMFYNALGGVTWAVLFGVLGFLFGRHLPALERYVGQASLALVLLAALIAVLVVLWRRFDLSGAALWRGAHGVWDRCCGLGVVQRLHARYPRASAFVVARFTPGEFLGLHLTLGILLSLGALWLFGGITEDVLHHDPLTRFDLALATWLRAHATPLGDRIFVAVSLVGSPLTMATLAAVVALVLAWRRRWIVLVGWTAAFAGGGVLDRVLKEVIRRPRPVGAAAFLHGASFSFPSGHAMGSLVGYGMLAYLLASRGAERPRTRTAIAVSAVGLVLAIGFSRLYLGVHYFSDVIAGYAAGVVWLMACVSGVEVAERQRETVRREIGPSPARVPRTAAGA
jgi:membrane-associated phospholipid phosphatase